MRVAIYFIPPADHDLTVAAAAWLGRDVYSGATMPPPSGRDPAEHARLTADARRYGFHATMKAPFRLAGSWTLEDLGDRLDTFTARQAPFELDLSIGQLGSFFAYLPQTEVSALHDVAASVVAEFDHFRAPLSEADLARRNMAGLSERQLSHLMTWGYPYVFDQFRFHMTLTGPVSPAGRDEITTALHAHFGTAPRHIVFSQLVLAVEPEDGAPFTVLSVHSLARTGARLTA